mmetsp:Transcript_4020/g.7126  ORF Transcript_4020/g.7126 Transcript_4020/m.7126 type:complete len:289 (-) Transcript_4020:27-893(-)
MAGVFFNKQTSTGNAVGKPSRKHAATAAADSSVQNLQYAVQDMSRRVEEKWDQFCSSLETSGNDHVVWFSRTLLRHVVVEAPTVITFCLICVLLHFLNLIILPGLSFPLGVDSELHLKNPLQYIRFFTHIFVHDSLGHLKGNMTNLLLVGPSAEASFGSRAILHVILVVAVSSSLSHVVLGRQNSRQLGASGVVFAMILLNSLVAAKRGKIPVSFILISFLYLGDEMWKLFFISDGVSHSAHLVGGFVGTITGFQMDKQGQYRGNFNDRHTSQAQTMTKPLVKQQKQR